MKTAILFGLALLTGCAYGQVSEPEQTYGHSNPYADGGSAYNNGSSDWSQSDESNGIPYGCVEEVAYDHGYPIFSFVYCPSKPQMAYKWLVDPPPDHQGNKEKQ